MRRAATLCLTSHGPEHPHTQGVLNNYTLLLQDLGLPRAEIQSRLAALNPKA